MTQIRERDRLTAPPPETKQPVREPPVTIDLRPSRRRWVRWVEWVAVVVAFALTAAVATYLVTRDGGEPEPRFTGDMIASQLREGYFPGTADTHAYEQAPTPYWSSTEAWNAFLAFEAPTPYWSSTETWNDFLAYDLAPTPYWSSTEVWSDFVAYEQAPPPYWSSIEVWNHFLEMSASS